MANLDYPYNLMVICTSIKIVDSTDLAEEQARKNRPSGVTFCRTAVNSTFFAEYINFNL